AFPLRRRQDPFALSADVDARLLPETELIQVIMDAVDAHEIRDIVEVHVARRRERLTHVDRAVAAWPPIAPGPAHVRHAPVAAAEAGLGGKDDAVFERGERHQRLHGRAGRIDAAQRAVVHGAIRIFREREILRTREAAREEVRIEARRADEGDDVSVRRIDCDGGGSLSAQRFLRSLLHALIDREVKVVARERLMPLECGGLGPDALDASALRIDEQLLIARAPVQLGFVGAFDAGLARQSRARVLLDVESLLVVFADRADIADRVHAGVAERVVAGQARPDLDAGELVSTRRKPRELFLSQLQLYRHGIEAASRTDIFLDRRNIRAFDQAELCKPVQRLIDVAYLLACELELIRRRVRRERQAVAIENQAAIGRNGLDP